MKRSDRFRKFSEISSELENNAGAELAASRSQLDAQKNQLQELKKYLVDYQHQLQAKLAISSSALVINGYQQFISSIKEAIAIQEGVVRKSEIATENLRKNWIEKKVDVNKFDKAAKNIKNKEIAYEEKLEQLESDDRALKSFHREKSLAT